MSKNSNRGISLEEPLFAISLSFAALTFGFLLPLVVGLKSVSNPGKGTEQKLVQNIPGSAISNGLQGGPAGATLIGTGAGSGGAGSGGAGSEVVSAASGGRLYNALCVACHQAEGMGKVGLAPFIRNPDFLALASDKFLTDTITMGRPGTAMVPWAHLKPHEVGSLVAYLREAEGQGNGQIAEADPTKKIPGDAAAGEGLYATYCAACHGLNATGYAEGGAGPAIGNAGFLAVASDDFIFQTVKHGRAGTPMRGFVGSTGLANLTEGQVGDIIAYLRNREAAVVVEETRPGDAKAGHMHYTTNCAACHQPDGSGIPGFAPSIRNPDFLALASDQFIKDTVRNGRVGTAMVQRPDLSDQVLADIVAYLRALPGGATPDIEVDPTKDLASLGDAGTGAETFGIYCVSCHGPDGKGYVSGGPGSAIGLSGFLDAASDDYIFQTLKQGRVGTPMRPFIGARGLANLSEQDAHNIIAYLRSLNSPAN